MRFAATVTVTLKPGVLDPQGSAVRQALVALGFEGVGEVAVGRHVALELEAPDRGQAEARAREVARRLLANPVLETFEVQVREAV